MNRNLLAIDRQALVQVGNLIAGDPYDPLDVIHAGARRVSKHHDVTPLRRGATGDFGIDDRQANAVSELVHQNQVADFQRGNHRAGRNFERLEQKRSQQEYCHDHRKQPRSPVQPPGLRQNGVACLRDIPINLGYSHAGELFATPRIFCQQRVSSTPALGQKVKTLGEPIKTGDNRRQKQQQGEIALQKSQVP